MKHKLFPKMEECLNSMAAELEAVMVEKKGHKHTEATKQYTKWTGEDLLLSNIEEVEGEPVDPEKEYIIGDVMTREVGKKQHHRRMKKAFMKNGVEGVCAYFKKFNLVDREGIHKIRAMLDNVANQNIN